MVSIIIDPDGNIHHIYDDALVDFDKSMGNVTIKRASHVEPTADGKWIADMSPVGGPKLPFYSHRSNALKAEKAWLENHNVPEVQDGKT